MVSKSEIKKIRRKQKRFQAMITIDSGIICSEQPQMVRFDEKIVSMENICTYIK